jgi:hypothetical protein
MYVIAFCKFRSVVIVSAVNVGARQSEQVNSFRYLGTMVNTDSSIEKEIKERIAAGNRAFHVHAKTIYIKINISKRQTTTL